MTPVPCRTRGPIVAAASGSSVSRLALVDTVAHQNVRLTLTNRTDAVVVDLYWADALALAEAITAAVGRSS